MENQDLLTLKGKHIITICDATSYGAKVLQGRIEKAINKRKELLAQVQQMTVEEAKKKAKWIEKKLNGYHSWYKFWLETLNRNYAKRKEIVYNITTTVGRTVLAQRLSGTTTYTGTVDYTALGSDNTAPVVGDATLGAEVYRKSLSSGANLANVAYLETFFTATEDTGTYEEYGMFIDGGAGADTGQLFNRFISSITKSATETLNVQSIITFNDA